MQLKSVPMTKHNNKNLRDEKQNYDKTDLINGNKQQNDNNVESNKDICTIATNTSMMYIGNF